ncbi:Uncharacterised protein [Leminorella richardii]|uniref:Pilus assembly protein, PilO n=1 Tax=Leminorella richardii TaxID=158841 RepID=A0A2X4U6M9_9GAMM|nr:hypothetical protein [Leminorella richardii]SQI34863.1 Uncharacterised protein [Leminorella richardii]
MKWGNDIDWRDLITAPEWVQHSAALTVALLTAAVSIYAFLFPLQERQALLEASLSEAKTRYVARLQRLGELPALSLIEANIASGILRLREYDSLASGAQSLIAAAHRSECRVIDIKHLADEAIPPFQSQRWQIRLRGNYFQLFNFIQHLGKGSAIAIDQLTMEESDGLTLMLTVEQYRLGEEVE